MMNLTDNNFIDLDYEVRENDIWNDIRVMVPRYDSEYILVDGVWYRLPIDLVKRSTDGESINKYGRRTKTQKTHVINELFSEAYCEGEVLKRKEPYPKVRVKMIGKDAAEILNILSTGLSQRVNYMNLTSGLNSTGVIDSVQLDIDVDRIPRLTMMIDQLRPLDLLSWFIIDTDVIEGDHVIG